MFSELLARVIFSASRTRARIYPDPGGDPLGVASTSTATGRAGPADAVQGRSTTPGQALQIFEQGRVWVIWKILRRVLPRAVSDWFPAGCVMPKRLLFNLILKMAGPCVFLLPWEPSGVTRWGFAGTTRRDSDCFGTGTCWETAFTQCKAFADGFLLGEHEISVTTLGLGDFPRGLGGEYVVQDFPEMGKSTPLEWGQTRQNFVIAATRTVPANPGRIRNTSAGVMENPTAGSAHSGVAIVSGWHCNAESVRIELVNGNTGEVISTQAGSGTERSDTAGVCGDSDNGYGLLWNWNILGDGWHTVRAFADEETEPFSWSTVFVTTLGEEFARGLSGEYEVADFPSAGQSVMVEWRQEQQNFVITGVE